MSTEKELSRKQQAAEAARGILKKCEKKDDVVQARFLVDTARTLPKSHPLYQEFDWDNKVASDKWRLQQARQLIAYITILPAGSRRPIKAFVHLSKVDPKGGYRSIENVLNQTGIREYYVAQALSEFKSLRDKYEHLPELKQIVDAIDDAIEGCLSEEGGEKDAA